MQAALGRNLLIQNSTGGLIFVLVRKRVCIAIVGILNPCGDFETMTLRHEKTQGVLVAPAEHAVIEVKPPV